MYLFIRLPANLLVMDPCQLRGIDRVQWKGEVVLSEMIGDKLPCQQSLNQTAHRVVMLSAPFIRSRLSFWERQGWRWWPSGRLENSAWNIEEALIGQRRVHSVHIVSHNNWIKGLLPMLGLYNWIHVCFLLDQPFYDINHAFVPNTSF